MLDIPSTIAENQRRLAVIRATYNPLTGEGSDCLPRTKVHLDFPLPDLWLPDDFIATPFVQTLLAVGVAGFLRDYMHVPDTTDNREELWTEFSAERCRYDYEFFAYTNYEITDKETGRSIPFLLNRAQRKYLRQLEKLRLAGLPIDIILLKARQWGGSTLTQLYMGWIQSVLKPNWNSVICADVENQARIISGMLNKAFSTTKEWATGGMKIKTSPYQGSISTRVINVSGSRFSVGSAQKPDKLRSENIALAHLSEVGLWKATKSKTPEDLVQSIFGSILSGPYTMKVLESTAKGVGNYFHKTWIAATKGQNNFTPVFVAWYDIDIYSEPMEEKDYPDFISSLSEYEAYLFEIGATLEAIKWYRAKRREMNDDWRMFSEYPSSAVEAFQSTGQRVFPQNYVQNARHTTEEPWWIGNLVADADTGPACLKNIKFELLSAENEAVLRQMHAAKSQLQSPSPTPTIRRLDYLNNCLWVWLMPDLEIPYIDRYITVVDPGGGITDKADYTSIKVFDRLEMLSGGIPELAAEWHGRLDPDKIAWKAAQIAEAYGHSLLVIESNKMEADKTEGENFEFILSEISEYYDNLYSRTSEEQIRKGMPVRWGFHTNTSTKPMIINSLKKALRDGLYIERSEPTCDELDLYELKEDGKTMGAVEGNHDDRVITAALGIFICYDWRMPIRKNTEKASRSTKVVSEASI